MHRLDRPTSYNHLTLPAMQSSPIAYVCVCMSSMCVGDRRRFRSNVCIWQAKLCSSSDTSRFVGAWLASIASGGADAFIKPWASLFVQVAVQISAGHTACLCWLERWKERRGFILGS